MANISLGTGTFSGLNTNEIITSLMSVERKPLEKAQAAKQNYETRVSAYGEIGKLLASLRSTALSLKETSLLSLSATSSNKSVLTATASSTAESGQYAIVVDKIAQSQNIYSGPFTTRTDAVADLSVNNTQQLKIQLGSKTATTITINSSNNTLTGIKDAINAASDDVSASIVNDGSGFRLVLSSRYSGATNRMTVTVDEENDGVFSGAGAEIDGAGLSRLAFNATYDADGLTTGGVRNMTQSQAAINAALTVNGLDVTSESNTVTDVVPGVTLNLLADSEGAVVSLNVATNTSAASTKVGDFVKAYNAAMSMMRSLAISNKDKAALLTGDSASRTMMDGLRTSFNASYESNTMAALGLTHDKTGVLSADYTKLNAALDADFEGTVASLDAMASAFEDKLDIYINSLIPSRTTGLASSIDRMEDRIAQLEFRMAKKEEIYRRQFANMEEILGRLQKSGDYLSQQMSSISKIGSGSKT